MKKSKRKWTEVEQKATKEAIVLNMEKKLEVFI